MSSRVFVLAAVTLAYVVLLHDGRGEHAAAAGLTCETQDLPTAPSQRPAPPTGMRIISNVFRQLFLGVPLTASSSIHDYYESLASRPDCLVALSLRSQAQLDAYPTSNKNNPKKRPVVYDTVHDAARIDIYAPVSTDIQGKYLPTPIDRTISSWLLTFDFRFDEHFRWLPERKVIAKAQGKAEEKGYTIRHKTWRFMPRDQAHWFQIRTDYKHAANVGRFAEVFVGMPSKQYLGPKASRGAPGWLGEMLQPRVGEFFLEPNTWTRMWFYIQDFDKSVCRLSMWVADHKRIVQVLDSVTLYPPREGIQRFQIEYDTSGDVAINPEVMHSWNRNVVVLKNVSRAAVGDLLRRP